MESDATTSSMPVEDGYNEYVAPKRKRKKKSLVWRELLEGKNEKGEVIATCTHCGIDLVSGSTSGTSHLKRHLLERCPKRPNGVPLGEASNDDEGREFIFDMKELRKEILLYVVEGSRPFSTVEDKAFRRMMFKATPHFKPFSRTTLTSDLFSMYYSDREKLKTILLSAPGLICLTTDNWKSSHTWQHYICITVHFVDNDWKLHKRILKFKALSPPYDGESISEEIYMFLNHWRIDDKVLSVTVDNASYNDAMITHLRSRLVARGVLRHGGCFFHIRCCAHIINLIVQSGLGLIQSILDSVRNLVKMITRSSSRSKDFYDVAQKNFHLDVKRKLHLDMQIRWNSTYKMLDNVLYYKVVFLHLGSVHVAFKYIVPTDDEWEKLIVVHKFLKLFYDVTCMFSANKSPTSNIYFKGAWMVHRRLVETSKGPHVFLRDMVKPMLKNFDKYWSDYNVYLSCAAILDPRFKVKFVEYCFDKLFGPDEAMVKVGEVLTTLRSLYDEYKLRSSTSPIVVPTPTSGIDDDLFDDYHSYSSRSIRTQITKSQLDSYLEDPERDLNSEMNILEFWQQNVVRFPDLASLARDLLTIPVSTVASESAFSLSGKIISPNRSSLKPKTVQALVCIQDWRRDEHNVPLDFDLDPSSGDDMDEVEDDEDDEDVDSNFLY
ncbi:hypothetical protein BVRB_1g013000 [Beta vulgaris subsp. vulgaris]|nr:hypothetical protein BVRB_1g013000 [Beta vulgaris subsp. vulgaris]